MQARSYLLSLLAGTVALYIPLIRDLHFESALLAGTVGAFWGGISAAAGGTRGRGDLKRTLSISGYLVLGGVPLLLNALVTGCYTVEGLGFWVFIPLPSTFFGAGIGRCMRELQLPFPRAGTVLLLVLVSTGVLLYEFLTLPKLYFFNHVWGYWPGPIYDEAVPFPLAMPAFRFLTLCWTVLLWLIPVLDRDTSYKWIAGLAVIGLLAGYAHLDKTRIITTSDLLQTYLGGERQTETARIFYDRDGYPEQEIDRITAEVDFYIREVKQALRIDEPDSTEKIELYLYADPWQKKELVGAKHTSYVTVWQRVPQIHIAGEQVDGSLKHEVVHAVTALLEWPGLLPNVGLTEGIAVALDPDRSPRSTIDQLVAAREPYPSAEEMAASLSYWGFYTGRSAVNYTTAGSFVRYLVETRPPEQFVKAYECGSVEQGYPEPFPQLIKGWHRRLDSVRVDSSDRQRARRIFGQLSIFEQPCPHKIAPPAKIFDRFLLSRARKDTNGAIAALAELKDMDPGQGTPLLLWMIWNLEAGNPGPVVNEPEPDSSRVEIHLLKADAYQMNQKPGSAQQHLARAMQLADERADTSFNEAFAFRLDSLQWSLYRQLRYRQQLLSPAEFETANYRIKMRAVGKALDVENAGLVTAYASELLQHPVELDFFDTFEAMIHRLAFQGGYELAAQWIEKLNRAKDLSLRYRERLDRQRAWLAYMETYH
ncbi:MAG: hypothetical protein R3281_03650 [Balneolaceae bacterium]|nr:hypothetical protein [Balneolaceae bacterium]